jgi:hypothetical protein
MSISSSEGMAEAGLWALSSAELKCGHRIKGNFIQSDNLSFDFDGPDAGGVKQAVPEAEVYRIMKGIAFRAVTSLSGGWHVFCPLKEPITDWGQGQALKAAWVAALGADAGAKDLVRAYYGTPPEALKVIEGEGELIDTLDRARTQGPMLARAVQPGARQAAPLVGLSKEEHRLALERSQYRDRSKDTYSLGIRKDCSAFLAGEQPPGTRFPLIPSAVGCMFNRGYAWEQVEDVIRLNWAHDPPEKRLNAEQWALKCYEGLKAGKGGWYGNDYSN